MLEGTSSRNIERRRGVRPRDAFTILTDELEGRKIRNAEQPGPQEYLGLVWHYSYKPGKQVSNEEWARLFGEAGLNDIICPDTEIADAAGFVSIGEIDLKDIWPRNYDCHGELLVSLRRWNSLTE